MKGQATITFCTIESDVEYNTGFYTHDSDPIACNDFEQLYKMEVALFKTAMV